jgi:hypothetical protein
MSNQEKRSNELTPFEAALAGLAPRVEGFDRERLIFLAGQASVLGDRAAGASPDWERAGGMRARRWAWPAAFSAMTAVAAALLVMLCTRPAATIAMAVPKDTASGVVKSAPAAKLAVAQPQSDLASPSDQREVDVADASSADTDPALRAELRRRGIDFSRPRVISANGPIVVAEAPLTYFELLSRLQGQGPAGQGSLKEMMQ